jgi:hypothetical protein
VTALSGLSDDFAQPLDFLSAGIIRRGDTLKGETTLNLSERIANNPVVRLNVRERLLPSAIRRVRGEIPDETFNALKKEIESDEITGALRGTVERFSLEKYIKAAQSDLKELREQILPALLKAPKVPKNVMQVTPQAMAQIDEIQAARTALMDRAFDAEGVTRQLMADAERLGGDAKAVKALNKVDDEIVKARSRLVAAENQTNEELVELAKEFRRGAREIPLEVQEKLRQLNSSVFDMEDLSSIADTRDLRRVNQILAEDLSREGAERFAGMRVLRDAMKSAEPTGNVVPEAAMDAMRLNPFDDARVPTSDMLNSFIREAVNDPFRGNIGPNRGFFDYGA